MSTVIAAVLCSVGGAGALVVGGVFFGFSGFVMRGLVEAGDRAGLAAMQGINRAAVRPPLMLALFGTLLAGLAACVMLAVAGAGAALWWAVAAEAVYLGGVVAVTAGFHVPRNNFLAALDPSAPEAAFSSAWRHYATAWTRGNHVRTVAGVLAGTLFGVAAALTAAPALAG
jgi:uncharacterized membrane protein